MTRLATELGVTSRTNTPVDRMETHQGRIGAVITPEQRYETNTVSSNVDVTTTYKHLLHLPYDDKFELSCSGFIMMLGVKGTHDKLKHHNVFFSADYEAEFRTIFKEQKLAQDPTIYVAITSKTDADHAPANCENWFILVNVPALSHHVDWEKEAQPYRDLIISRLAAYGYDLDIITEQILTPVDLQSMSGAWRGALYGASANSKWTAFRRPHNRSKDIKGLYFAGGTTHPGGGVPMVTLSGKVAAEMVLED